MSIGLFNWYASKVYGDFFLHTCRNIQAFKWVLVNKKYYIVLTIYRTAVHPFIPVSVLISLAILVTFSTRHLKILGQYECLGISNQLGNLVIV